MDITSRLLIKAKYIKTTYEKSVRTTELHYSTKKRENSFSILKSFYVRHSSEYETLDNDRKVDRNIREQPPRTCKNSNSKMKSDSAIGQHLIKNPECAKTYTDDNFRIIGQARSSFNLSVLESVYIKTQNPVLCKQKSLFSHLNSSSKQW